MSLNRSSSYNAGFDLAKSILALLVVVIHTVLPASGKFSSIAAPITRIAVPVFFIFSGYFFFLKLQKHPQEDHFGILIRAVKRNLQLYLFWFLVLLVPTIYARSYFANGIVNGIKLIITGFFFSSTFIASWFIMALIIGIPVIYFVSKFMNIWLLLIFCWAINCIYVILSNYGMSPVGITLSNILGKSQLPYLSFPVGLLWIVIGKLFAENKFDSLISKKSLLFSLIALIPLYFEQWYIVRNHFSLANDYYFMLIPVSTLIFGFVLTLDIKLSFEKELRAFSTITYCLHATLAAILRTIFSLTGFYRSLLLWFITVIFCIIATLIITRIEKKSYFKWLRFSH